jgi:dihydrofolate reductase
LNETVENSGAVIIGWRTYDIAIDDAWGGISPFKVPAFVLAKNVPEIARGGSSFTFVTDGIESAIK